MINTSNVYTSIIEQKTSFINLYTCDVFLHVADSIRTFYNVDNIDHDWIVGELKTCRSQVSQKYVKELFTNAIDYVLSWFHRDNQLQVMTDVYDLYVWLNGAIEYCESQIAMAVHTSVTQEQNKLKALLRIRYLLTRIEWYVSSDTAYSQHKSILESITKQDIGLAMQYDLYSITKSHRMVNETDILAKIAALSDIADLAPLLQDANGTINFGTQASYVVTEICERIVYLEERVKELRNTSPYEMKYDFNNEYANSLGLAATKYRSVLDALLSIEVVEN